MPCKNCQEYLASSLFKRGYGSRDGDREKLDLAAKRLEIPVQRAHIEPDLPEGPIAQQVLSRSSFSRGIPAVSIICKTRSPLTRSNVRKGFRIAESTHTVVYWN